MRRCIFYFSLLSALLACAIAAVAQGATGPVTFQLGPSFQKRCLSPSPSPGASNQAKKAAIGHGKAMIDTGDPKNSSWTEVADLADAGTATNADMLWDASSKIFYAFAHTTLQCTHGKSVEADLLIGVYGKRNFLSKVPGSGWWVVDLQQNQCQAPLAGLYGCKFDAQGNILACGRAEVDPRINDVAIVESTRF
jgi:hypothetical protein